MYDNYNEKGLGRMTIGSCFGIGSLCLLFDTNSYQNINFLLVTIILSFVVFLHGYFAHKEDNR
jgi:hypothetical protein